MLNMHEKLNIPLQREANKNVYCWCLHDLIKMGVNVQVSQKNATAQDGWKCNIPELFFYYYLVCEAIGTAATPDLLCQPRVIVKMIVEKQMECGLVGETEVLGENLLQRHFFPS
jgi:hypothetical protein